MFVIFSVLALRAQGNTTYLYFKSYEAYRKLYSFIGYMICYKYSTSHQLKLLIQNNVLPEQIDCLMQLQGRKSRK